jgi:protein-S-isoprenylcysteine O-methyltransferase Ste14
MPLLYDNLFPAMWMAWALYWWARSRHVKPVARRESLVSRLLHIGPLLIAILLLWVPRVPFAFLDERILAWTESVFWIGAALTAAGLLFTVWARVHLGTNWSGTVTIKKGHELITSGPYALVRHPIYTGLLLAFAGSALARDELRGILAFVLVLWALWRKLRNEERWMREQFGEAYSTYARRVAALIPFVL